MSIAGKRSLQEITSEPNMKVLQYVAETLVKNWQSVSSIGATEWETAKNAVTKEERKKALDLFLEELEKLANE